MSDELAHFYDSIAPFRKLWRTLKITVVAVRYQEHWISLCCRVLLSYSEPGPDLRIEPADYFLALSLSRPACELEHLLGVLHSSGILEVGSGVEEQVYLTLAHAGLEAPAHPLRFFFPAPSWHQPREEKLSHGESYVRLQVSGLDQHFNFVRPERIEAVSAKLRAQTPRFRNVLHRALDLLAARNLKDELQIDHLCKAINLSASRPRDLFHQQLGMSPAQALGKATSLKAKQPRWPQFLRSWMKFQMFLQS
jgi:AraC-like DNA-binding protein